VTTKKIALAGATIILVGALGFYVAARNSGAFIKAGIETFGPKILGASIKIRSVTLSPLSGSGRIRGVVIGNPKGFNTPSAFKLSDVRVKVDLSSLLDDKIVIEEILIRKPKITYEGGLRGSNIAALMHNVERFAGSSSASSKSGGGAVKLQINRFELTGAKVSVSMKALKGKTATLPLPPVKVTKLGQGPNGVTPASAVKRIMGAVVSATKKAVLKAGGPKQLLGGGKKLAGEGKKAAKKALGGVKKLFGK
jgi:hypothetical protein